MKHIRFLTEGEPTICDRPDLIEEHFVVVDYEPEDDEVCRECPQLLYVANMRAYLREIEMPLEPPPSNWARGVMWGILLSSPAWIALFALAFIIWMVAHG